MGGEDRCGGTGGGCAARSIFGSVMMSEGRSGTDLVNANAWSRGSIAGSRCAPVVAVGGPVAMRHGS